MSGFERGRAAWPTVRLERATFDAHIAQLGAGDQHAEDLYLACACARGDREALAQLDAKLLSQVPAYLARIDPSPTVAEEVKQILRTELLVAPPGKLPRIGEYSGRGPLAGWLRVSAVRRLHRLRQRKLDRAPSSDALVSRLVSAEPTAEVALMRARHGAELAAAIKHAISLLPPRDRSIIKLHVLEELTVDDLGALFNVHRSTVARWIVRLKQQLFDEATRLLADQLQLDSDEAASLCRAVRSQLDLSLGGVFEGDE